MDTSDIKTSDEAEALAQRWAVQLQVMRVRSMTFSDVMRTLKEKADHASSQVQLFELQLADVQRRAGELKELESAPPPDDPA